MITEPQALALATLVGQIRTDWNPQGVLALIHKNRDAHPFPALARAAVNAATNPSNRTPAVIFMQGSHWAEPNTMSASERRLQKGYELLQRAAAREPQHNPFDTHTGQPLAIEGIAQ